MKNLTNKAMLENYPSFIKNIIPSRYIARNHIVFLHWTPQKKKNLVMEADITTVFQKLLRLFWKACHFWNNLLGYTLWNLADYKPTLIGEPCVCKRLTLF